MAYDVAISLAVWTGTISRLAMMIGVASIALILISILEERDGKKRPRGVSIFCILLILGSVYKLWGFWSYGYYRFMFQQLTEQEIFIRYIGSVALRLIGLVVAAGVLLLNNKFRKTLLLLCIFTLCSLYWKHPFFVFDNIARYSEQLILNKLILWDLTRPSYPWISLIFYYMVDIVFSGSALYYFTRPQVKEYFK